MTDHAAITAELEEVKPVKTRKCLQIICEVPMESADAALEALGGFPIPGQSRPVAIALLKPTATRTGEPEPVVGPSLAEAMAAQQAQPPAEQTEERPKGGPICKRAVLLCKNPTFRAWMFNRTWITDTSWPDLSDIGDAEERTAVFLRHLCGDIDSRAELDHSSYAAGKFAVIEREFYQSQRGDTDAARLAQRDRT